MTRTYEVDPDRATELGAPIDEVAQDAIEATASLYTNDATVDVESQLRDQLRSRGVRTDEQSIVEIAHEIRSGHHVDADGPDGG